VIRRKEARRIDGGRLVRLVDRRERRRARLALRAGAGAVRQNGENPGAQRGATLESGESLQHGHPSLLDHLLRDRIAAHEHERYTHHGRMMTLHERKESRLVTCA
jgi:hypothetical protein